MLYILKRLYMVCAEIKKQQLKTLTQQLKNVEVKEGQSELSLTISP